MSTDHNMNDSALEMVMERFNHMENSTNARIGHLEETLIKKLDDQNTRIAAIEKTQTTQSAFMDKWKGGMMVLAGIGSVAGWAMGSFEWLAKYFTMR